ncbi:hypothetical protein FGO68_gene15440 [Halteria grandinella]|uniref:sphingomyelin phosphodiesterase n=1 Tax=Halteria grandinella TaxID=5974 RepID=A0A8J8T857_HALGN|nr:hypothetical protein FGO68_gene15440 [Halteria grandinella]
MVDKKVIAKIETLKHPLNKDLEDIPLKEVSRTNQISLLSYNFFLRPVVKNVEDDWKDERLEAFVSDDQNCLAQFDIICFQEVFDFINKQRRQKLISYAEKAGYFYHRTSDPAPLFSSMLLDGGLLTISRFPIVESEFKPYPISMLSDALTYKGVLYCKIDIQGKFLHIFQSHTQASYFSEVYEEFEASINTRQDQIRNIRQFVEEKTQNADQSDLIIVCGDLNINGRKVDRVNVEGYRHMDTHTLPQFRRALDQYDMEYDQMVSILSRDQEDKVIDVMRKANGGESPITFGDVIIDKEGKLRPTETQMVKEEDYCIMNSLDYIFQLQRSFQSAGPDNEVSSKSSKSLSIDHSQSRVQKFLYDSHPKVKQMSDHFGVSTIIKLQ